MWLTKRFLPLFIVGLPAVPIVVGIYFVAIWAFGIEGTAAKFIVIFVSAVLVVAIAMLIAHRTLTAWSFRAGEYPPPPEMTGKIPVFLPRCETLVYRVYHAEEREELDEANETIDGAGVVVSYARRVQQNARQRAQQNEPDSKAYERFLEEHLPHQPTG